MITDKLSKFKLTTFNEMADGDLERFIEIFIDEKDFSGRHFDHFYLRNTMTKLGAGMYGEVYEFIGSDGYEYAVKVFKLQDDYHDGKILADLQEIKGFPKLFFYIEGTSMNERPWGDIDVDFVIMVSQKINGFIVDKIAGDVDNDSLELFTKCFKPDIIDVFNKSIDLSFQKGLEPSDVHSHNVMFDIEEGIFYIVDVGKFDKVSAKEVDDNCISNFRRYSSIDKLYETIYSTQEVAI